MQVFPELISYIELIGPRAHCRPPTKNEILPRPKCRQGPDDCVYTWGKHLQMFAKEKAFRVLGHISGTCLKTKWYKQICWDLQHASQLHRRYIWIASCMHAWCYILGASYVRWLYLGPPWNITASPNLMNPPRLHYLELIETFTMWMLGRTHTYI